MLQLSRLQEKVYLAIKERGYSKNMWKELGFSTHAQFSEIIRLLVFGGYIREQPKYKAVRKG